MDDDRLSHGERTMLEALEAGLRRDDPGFVTWFTLASHSLETSPSPAPKDVLARWLRRREDGEPR